MSLPTLHHSFITLHENNDTYKLCAELSVLYAINSGYDIVLHTDEKGAKIFKDLQYTDILCDLNDVQKAPGRIYAHSKFAAYENIPLGDIHIDADVFIKKPCLKEFGDVIVQGIESIYDERFGYFWNESVRVFFRCDYPIWASRKCEYMYNCGVIGFNNEKLKKEYIDSYWWMLNQYKTKGVDAPSVPDIIIEQQFLYDICKYYDAKVTKVLDNITFKHADDIGYQHLLGQSKHREIENIKYNIKKLKS